MSLFLTVKQILNIRLEGQIKVIIEVKKIEQKFSLVLQNSKSGVILVKKMKFGRIQYDDDYKFTASINENIEFILIKGQQKQAELQQNVIGRGKLYTQKFLKMFQQKIQQKVKKNQFFQYQITLYKQTKKQEIAVGVVKLHAQFDPHKKYEGQVITNTDLDLRGQLTSNPKFIKFYLGKTKNINIFNIVDQKAKDPKCRFVQSIYRDIQ